MVLLVPPEMLRGFERGPAGAVAALAAARPGRYAAALCLHPGRLRAPLPRRVHRAGPSALRATAAAASPRQKLGSASDL